MRQGLLVIEHRAEIAHQTKPPHACSPFTPKWIGRYDRRGVKLRSWLFNAIARIN
jgi:hypothetical protein